MRFPLNGRFLTAEENENRMKGGERGLHNSFKHINRNASHTTPASTGNFCDSIDIPKFYVSTSIKNYNLLVDIFNLRVIDDFPLENIFLNLKHIGHVLASRGSISEYKSN